MEANPLGEYPTTYSEGGMLADFEKMYRYEAMRSFQDSKRLVSKNFKLKHLETDRNSENEKVCPICCDSMQTAV